MSVYFIRHGKTDWNGMERLQGQSDIALNHEGRLQAYVAKKALKETNIQVIYCSPLLRAKQTADILNEDWKLPIYYDKRLMERCFGELEGKQKDIWSKLQLWRFEEDINHGVETMSKLFQRVYAFLDEITSDRYQNMLIVAHGGVSIPFTCYFDNCSRQQDLKHLIVKNCELIKRDCKINIHS